MAPEEAVAARLAVLHPDLPVRCAYLEFDQPELAQAVAQVVAAGARSVTIVPMFLGSGKHAREDVPALVASLRTTHPEVNFDLRAAVGDDTRVLDLLASIALE